MPNRKRLEAALEKAQQSFMLTLKDVEKHITQFLEADTPTQESLENMRLYAHTLAGASAMFNHEDIGIIAAKAERELDAVLSSSSPYTLSDDLKQNLLTLRKSIHARVST